MKRQKDNLAAVRQVLGEKAMKPSQATRIVGGLRDGYPEGSIGG